MKVRIQVIVFMAIKIVCNLRVLATKYVFCSACLCLTSCGVSLDVEKELEGHLDGPLKIYRHSLDEAPSSIDPAHSASTYTNHLILNVYDTLYRYKYLARPYQLAPNLATSMPQVSVDGLTYLIKIKRGVYYIDDPAFPTGIGRELLADDFVYSIKRHFDVKNRSQGAWLWSGRIVGLDQWKQQGSDYSQLIEGLTTVDPYTIKIVLNAPYPQLIHSLSQGYSAIVPHEAVDYYGREFSVHPVGSGPFKMFYYDPAHYAMMVRNIKYRKEPIDLAFEGYVASIHEKFKIDTIAGKIPPLVDAIKIDFIPERAPRWASFTKGDEIEYTLLDAARVDQVLEKKYPDPVLKEQFAQKYYMNSFTEAGFLHTDFNMRDPSIGYTGNDEQDERNRNLRCAIRSAVDLDERNKVFYSGLAVTFPGIIPPLVPEFDPALSHASSVRNIEFAKGLLTKGGWNADNLPVLSYGGVGSVKTRQFYQQFRGWMRDIGYPEEKIVFDSYASFGDFSKRVKESKITIIYMGWALDYPDAQNTLQLFYGPYASPGSNSSNFNNEAYNRLYEKTSTMLPSEQRTEMYSQMNQMVIDACVTISGLSRTQIMLWHKRVISFSDRQIVGGFHFKFIDLVDDATVSRD